MDHLVHMLEKRLKRWKIYFYQLYLKFMCI
jgi:hypothetical protein